MNKTLWSFLSLVSLLFGRPLDSAQLPSSIQPLSISTWVGNQVVLPCSWRTNLGVQVRPECHVQWVNPPDTVFEQRGGQQFQAKEFRGRLEVPEDKLGSGDCSLIISDVQLGDVGNYDSFMVVDGQRDRRSRVFIQSVRLSVHDHKSQQVGLLGGQVVLDLHTRFSVRVVFQSRNGSEWSVLWERRGSATPRLEKDPLQEQLTLKNLEPSDEGTYKVLDEQGLSVSTVQLTLQDNSWGDVSPQKQNTTPTGVADRSSGSVLLLLSLLTFSFHISRFL